MSAKKLNYQNQLTELQRRVEMLRKERDSFEFENSANFVQVKDLRESIGMKEVEISSLKSTVNTLQQDLKSICGDFLFECRDLKKVSFSIIKIFFFVV